MSGMSPDGNGRVDIVPGGENFVDIKAIFEDGAKEIKEGELVTISGFDLNDAMAALEIMDPRMDSGLLPEAPPFDPNILLLPEEVCWILDRTFASEVGWHNGLALSQTVLTIRYVHYLADIGFSRFKTSDNTSSHPYSPTSSKPDPNRPPELVNLVLRAGIFGLVKCCDLVWRELSQNRVLEGEDWNSDKFNVSLCEHIQPEKVISLLGDALVWLRQTPAISNVWRSALTDRILLRKNILQMLYSPSTIALQNAKQDLAAILSTATTPNPSPRVMNAIDPNITRHLISSIPIRNIPQLSQKEAWAAWKIWLEQWDESRRVIDAERLWSVKLLAEMRVYENKPQRRTAFLRSVASSTFFNGSKILLNNEPPWVVDRFFYETAAIPPGLLPDAAHQLTDTLLRSFNNIDAYTDGVLSDDLSKELTEGVDNFEKMIASLLVDFFTSFYHNRARQRRIFAGSLLEWHLAYEQAMWITSYLKSAEPLEVYTRIPLCVRYARLMIISQVILSGFELELYAQSEWAMIYWYLAEVLSMQISVLNEIHSSLLQETSTPDIEQAVEFVAGQRDYAYGLQGVSLALRDILFHMVSHPVQVDAELEQAKFRIRFKWAFVKGYSGAQGPDQDRPILGKWRRWCMQAESRVDWQASAVEALRESNGIFSRLATSASKTPTATFCVDEYQQFLTSLGQICHVNAQVLVKFPDITHNVQIGCLWERSKWFPVLDHSTGSNNYSS